MMKNIEDKEWTNLNIEEKVITKPEKLSTDVK
jgi:hypothetical protein